MRVGTESIYGILPFESPQGTLALFHALYIIIPDVIGTRVYAINHREYIIIWAGTSGESRKNNILFTVFYCIIDYNKLLKIYIWSLLGKLSV